MRNTGLLTVALILAAGPALAQAAGLIVANRDYQNVGNVSGGDRPARAARDFERAGMRVITLTDAGNDELQQGFAEFAQMS